MLFFLFVASMFFKKATTAFTSTQTVPYTRVWSKSDFQDFDYEDDYEEMEMEEVQLPGQSPRYPLHPTKKIPTNPPTSPTTLPASPAPTSPTPPYLLHPTKKIPTNPPTSPTPLPASPKPTPPHLSPSTSPNFFKQDSDVRFPKPGMFIIYD